MADDFFDKIADYHGNGVEILDNNCGLPEVGDWRKRLWDAEKIDVPDMRLCPLTIILGSFTHIRLLKKKSGEPLDADEARFYGFGGYGKPEYDQRINELWGGTAFMAP